MIMASTADQAGPDGEATRQPVTARWTARRSRALAESAVVLVMAVLLALGARAFAFQTYWIPSTSMLPTLQVGDRILVQKAFFNWHDLHRGDIVVFSKPPRDHCGGAADSDLVKRVIALPGQTIYSAGNTVFVNGRPLAEPYLPRIDPLGPAIPDASRLHPFRVPAGDVYLLGDNRQISCDSRFWGPVKGSSIVGRVVLLLWRDGHPDLPDQATYGGVPESLVIGRPAAAQPCIPSLTFTASQPAPASACAARLDRAPLRQIR
jgi:signal peptidase I